MVGPHKIDIVKEGVRRHERAGEVLEGLETREGKVGNCGSMIRK